MTAPFNAEEAFQIAIRMEKNGDCFYTWAADRAEDPQTKQLLLDLADMEKEHLRRFEAMKPDSAPGGLVQEAFDPDHQAAEVLKAWADANLFCPDDDSGPPMTGKESMLEILQTALRLEQESVVFYSGLKDAAPEASRPEIEKIIKEELRHVALLGKAVAEAKKG